MAPVIKCIVPEKLKGLRSDNPDLCTLEATVVTGLEDVRISVESSESDLMILSLSIHERF